MKNRYTTYFVERVTPIEFLGKIVFFEVTSSGAFEPPFEIEPTKGEHDFTTCEGCKKNLAELTSRLTVKFEGNAQKKSFPFCCSQHSNLLKVKEFNRASFTNVPVMVARKIIYTNQHIINNHSSENWYKVITDYIEWVIESFGQMPKGCGERLYLSDYFFYVTDLLERNEEIKAETKARLREFIITYQPPSENPKTDLNVLLSTYQNWLKDFPFELNSYFGHLKQHYENLLPIMNGKPEKNIYSGVDEIKIYTKTSLIEELTNLTNSLLIQINGVTLQEKGLITDANKIKLELVINSRKQKLKQGYKKSSQNKEQTYMKMIEEWYADEKMFFDEITPLMKPLPLQQNETKTDKLNAELGKYGFFELSKVKQLSEPNKQSLIELISTNELPYSIAMFEYLGFLKYLKAEHLKTGYKLHKEVSKWFAVSERAVKGNIFVLNKFSKEDKTRYTAHKQKQIVQTDYEKLK